MHLWEAPQDLASLSPGSEANYPDNKVAVSWYFSEGKGRAGQWAEAPGRPWEFRKPLHLPGSGSWVGPGSSHALAFPPLSHQGQYISANKEVQPERPGQGVPTESRGLSPQCPSVSRSKQPEYQGHGRPGNHVSRRACFRRAVGQAADSRRLALALEDSHATTAHSLTGTGHRRLQQLPEPAEVGHQTQHYLSRPVSFTRGQAC